MVNPRITLSTVYGASRRCGRRRFLNADRIFLDLQDRFIADNILMRLTLAHLIRQHQPTMVFGTTGACIHPDHAAVNPLVTAAVFYARLDHWDRVPGGEVLADTAPWIVSRLFFPHCKMEPTWGDFAFAVDVSDTYSLKQARWQNTSRCSRWTKGINCRNYMKQKTCIWDVYLA